MGPPAEIGCGYFIDIFQCRGDFALEASDFTKMLCRHPAAPAAREVRLTASAWRFILGVARAMPGRGSIRKYPRHLMAIHIPDRAMAGAEMEKTDG